METAMILNGAKACSALNDGNIQKPRHVDSAMPKKFEK